MNEMFGNCSNLIELNLSNFNTNKVYSMEYIFFGCSSLKELNIDNFNFDKVIYFDNSIIRNCNSLNVPEILKNKFQKKDDNNGKNNEQKEKKCICF